jgi:hypothetical protein
LGQTYRDIEEVGEWFTHKLPKMVRRWRESGGRSRGPIGAGLIRALTRHAHKAASIQEYFLEEGGLFEMTLAVCEYDPEPFRRYAQKEWERCGLNESLAGARKLCQQMKREGTLKPGSSLYSAIKGSTGTS